MMSDGASVKTQEELFGFEHDWIACDGAGHVALFTTAGGSFAPEDYRRNMEDHEHAIKALLALPTTTRALSAPVLGPEFTNTWLEVAERGLFGFDGDFNRGPYRRVSVPARPALVEDLPASVQEVIRRLKFPELRFADLTRVPSSGLGGREVLP